MLLGFGLIGTRCTVDAAERDAAAPPLVDAVAPPLVGAVDVAAMVKREPGWTLKHSRRPSTR